MSEKTLSIIVPSYNMEKYLPKCLGSLVVAPELMDRLEVLVVNDGSKDRTSEIAHEFAAKWPGTFKVIDKENGHYGSCINAGLKVATGIYVKILDADDSFDTAKFEILLQQIEEYASATKQVDLLLTDFVRVEEGSDRVISNTLYGDGVHGWTKRFDELDRTVLEGLFMHGITYRRQMLCDLNYHQTEEVCYTDTQWALLPLISVERIAYVPCRVYRYLIGRSGQSVDPSVSWRKGYHDSGKFVLESLEFILTLRGKVDRARYEYVYLRILSMVAGIYSTALYRFHDDEADAYLRDFDRRLLEYSREAYVRVVNLAHWPPMRFRPIKMWRRKKSSKGWGMLVLVLLYQMNCLIGKLRSEVRRRFGMS